MRLKPLVRALVLALGVAVASTAAAGPTEDGNAGLEALKNGDYKHAEALFTRALGSKQLSNDDREFAYSQRGEAYLKDGAAAAALADFKRALKLKPDDADAQSGLEEAQSAVGDSGGHRGESSGGGGTKAAEAGMQALNGGDFARAIILFTRAIDSGRLSPDDKELALLSRGKAYLGKSDYRDAITDLSRALHMKADDQEAQTAFGQALTQVHARTPVAGVDEAACMKSFSTVGSVLSGKTYTAFAEYPTLSTFDAFAGSYTALNTYTPTPGLPWQITEADLATGSIKANITIADASRAITLELKIEPANGGSRITMVEKVPGLLPTLDLKGSVCHTLADATKG